MEPTTAGPRTVAAEKLLDRLSQRPAVLLGERHDSAAHHRWQLATLQALQTRRPELSLGLEMVPRRLQPVLDRWVAGVLEERSGLRVGDRITAIDGQPVSSARQVIERLAAQPEGRPLGLQILRGGRSLALQLALPGR